MCVKAVGLYQYRVVAIGSESSFNDFLDLPDVKIASSRFVLLKITVLLNVVCDKVLTPGCRHLIDIMNCD